MGKLDRPAGCLLPIPGTCMALDGMDQVGFQLSDAISSTQVGAMMKSSEYKDGKNDQSLPNCVGEWPVAGLCGDVDSVRLHSEMFRMAILTTRPVAAFSQLTRKYDCNHQVRKDHGTGSVGLRQPIVDKTWYDAIV